MIFPKPAKALFAAFFGLLSPEFAKAQTTDVAVAAAEKAFCMNAANLGDEDAPLNTIKPTWAEKLEMSVLSIGCLLFLRDEGYDVRAELKEKVRELQTTHIKYATNHNFEILDYSQDGDLGPLTSEDFIDISRYVGFNEVFLNGRYDPLSDTTAYLKRFGQEVRRFQLENFQVRVKELEDPPILCTGQPFGYDGICGASSASFWQPTTLKVTFG